MAIRVCPICDKKMKLAHFCTNCKSYIKEPVYWNRAYNLNGEGRENTIVNECENHNHKSENATGKVHPNYNTIPSRKEYHTTNEDNAGNSNERTVHKKKNPIMMFIFIYIALQIIIPLIAALLSIFM